jgi:hypothetical protein
MTNKLKILPVLLILTAAAIFTSCGTGTTPMLSVLEEKAFEDFVMSSYFIQRGDEAIAESRSAWPAHSIPLTFPAAGATTTAEKNNFPEKGQVTAVTIEPSGFPDIYLVTNVTTYIKRKDSISTTTESYYVKDVATIGTFNEDDLLWNLDTGMPGTQDFNKRQTYITEYTNGTTRYEKVEATTTEDSIKYQAFDIGGSLTFPAATTWSPTTDATANYSSMVSYIQEEGSAFNFWSDYKIIIGTRYYTEHGADPTKPEKTSVTYEKVIERIASESSLADKISAYASRLFDDSPTDVVYPGETLAQTVIRYKITTNNKKTVNTRTQVFDNNDGTSVVTFNATYEESEDGTVTSPGDPVATY